MKSRKPDISLALIEVRRFILPLTLTTIVFMVSIILDGIVSQPRNITLIGYVFVWIAITLVYDFLIAKPAAIHGLISWFYVLISMIGSGVLIHLLPHHLNEIFYIMIIF